MNFTLSYRITKNSWLCKVFTRKEKKEFHHIYYKFHPIHSTGTFNATELWAYSAGLNMLISSCDVLGVVRECATSRNTNRLGQSLAFPIDSQKFGRLCSKIAMPMRASRPKKSISSWTPHSGGPVFRPLKLVPMVILVVLIRVIVPTWWLKWETTSVPSKSTPHVSSSVLGFSPCCMKDLR
jgi:hypothetical protein